MKIAVVRGRFLNRYEMQFFEPLAKKHELTGFASLRPFHDRFSFPVVKLPCPLDVPEFPLKMPLLNRIFTDAHVLFGLENALKGFDIVHAAETYFRYSAQAIDARKRGYVKKVIATVLENIPFNNESIAGRKQLKAYVRSNLDRIIALTERTKAALILEGADPEKITVMGHFIDTDRFCPPPYWPARTGVKKRACRILFAGRLERYKGIYELLYAFRLLVNEPLLRGREISLTYAGSGSEADALRRMEERLGLEGRIRHVSGSYDSMPRHYQEADIYAAPSRETETWQEQYNTTLLEAQSAGLPIVTTASGGIPENVGDAAVIVNPGDVLSLKESLAAFILHPRRRLLYARRARDRALTVHDARLGAARLEKIYEALLA